MSNEKEIDFLINDIINAIEISNTSIFKSFKNFKIFYTFGVILIFSDRGIVMEDLCKITGYKRRRLEQHLDELSNNNFVEIKRERRKEKANKKLNTIYPKLGILKKYNEKNLNIIKLFLWDIFKSLLKTISE